jgi:hypothetical protein
MKDMKTYVLLVNDKVAATYVVLRPAGTKVL